VGILELIAERRIYIDSNPIIYLIEQYPRFADVLSELFRLIDDAQILATTSELTLAEVLVKPLRDQRRDLQQSFEQRLQTSGGLIVTEIDRPILVRAAEIRAAQASLRLPDAIHLATALETNCEMFLTNDGRIKSVELEVMYLSRLEKN
jgi:predicted nucleic acid-binding protein